MIIPETLKDFSNGDESQRFGSNGFASGPPVGRVRGILYRKFVRFGIDFACRLSITRRNLRFDALADQPRPWLMTRHQNYDERIDAGEEKERRTKTRRQNNRKMKTTTTEITTKDKLKIKMRTPGVEPGSQAWEACMMPLHYVRLCDASRKCHIDR